MKVKATQLGYHDHLRRYPGDVFTLTPRQTRDGKTITAKQQFSEKWMEKVPSDTEEHVSTRPEITPSNFDKQQELTEVKQTEIPATSSRKPEPPVTGEGSPSDNSETSEGDAGGASSGDEDVI